jgi:hypothetical protein
MLALLPRELSDVIMLVFGVVVSFQLFNQLSGIQRKPRSKDERVELGPSGIWRKGQR